MNRGQSNRTNSRRSLWASALFVCAVTLSACAGGMTADQCVNADWAAIGAADGRQGELATRFEKRAEACADHGVSADAIAYMTGRDAGLADLCTPDGGFAAGKSGIVYRGVCPPATEADFLSQYELGARLYELTEAHEAAVDDYEEAVSALDKHHYNLRVAENRVTNPNLSAEDRENARQDVEYHRREIDRIEYDLPLLGADIDRTRDALDDFRSYLRSLGR